MRTVAPLTWEIKVHYANGVEILRRVQAHDELHIGSHPQSDVFLPDLAAQDFLSIHKKGSSLEITGQGKGAKKSTSAGLEISDLKLGGAKLSIKALPRVVKSPYSPLVWAEDFATTAGPQTLWHFKGKQFIENLALETLKGKKRLGSGLELQWNFKNQPELSIREVGGKFVRIELTKNAKGSLEGQWQNEHFILTALRSKESLIPATVNYNPTEVPYEFKWDRFKTGMLAFWILFFAVTQFLGRSDENIEKAVEAVKTESYGTDMPSVTIENSKNPGGNGRRGGGGVEHVTTKDPRGGSGRSGVAKKSTQTFKAAKVSNPGGGAKATAKSSHVGSAKNSSAKLSKALALPNPSGSGLMSALSKLDSKVKSGAAGSGQAQIGGGKDIQGRDGVLGSLKGMSGTPGGGGLGIGGVGTKGFGGGGGGGRGAGFGTGIGEGLGEGHGARRLSFGGNGTIVRGGLEKSEIDRVVQENMSQVRYCFNKRLRSNPKLQGKVITTFTIGARGTVVSSRMKDSSLGSPDVESCILERIATWQFPKPRGGGEVSATVPFLLRAN